MAVIVFDVATFRVMFPAFSNAAQFPDAVLEMYWAWATYYIDDNDNYGNLQGSARALALNLMTAHLTAQSVTIAEGQSPAIMQNATIDKVTVGVTPPPLPNQWQWWLNTTPYGQQLLALLAVSIAGGTYIGGYPQLNAFRNNYGRFGA
jgi:hypothetical protein